MSEMSFWRFLTTCGSNVDLRSCGNLFDGFSKQVFEYFMDVIGSLDVTLFKKLVDDISLALSHLYLVNGFLFPYHNKKSSMI